MAARPQSKAKPVQQVPIVEEEEEVSLPVKPSSEQQPLAEKMAAFRDAIPRGEKVTVDAIATLRRHIGKTLDMSKELGYKSSDLAPIYRRVRDAMDAIAEEAKALLALVEVMNKTIIPEAFERDKLSTLTTDEGDRVTVSARLFASIIAEHKADAFKWLRENEYEDVIQETVNASTLSALAKELAEENKELPEEFFKTASINQTSLTRATAGKAKKAKK